MSWRATWLMCMGGVFLLLAGCQRLHHEKSWTLDRDERRYVEMDAPKSEQKVAVQVTATEKVSVYIVLENELRDFDKKNGTFDTNKALKSQKEVKSETFEVTVPAGKKFGVVVAAEGKKTDVKVVVDGK